MAEFTKKFAEKYKEDERIMFAALSNDGYKYDDMIKNMPV